jgi:acetyl esterase/lipase
LVAAQLTPRGYAVAGVAVRSSDHARFPAQLYDIKAAIRWLRAHAQQHRLDPAHIGIMGESSGGWAAAMADVTGDLPEFEGDVGLQGPSSQVQAAIPFYPPTDFLQMDAHMLEHGVAFNRDFDLTNGHADPRSPESRLMGYPIQTRPDDVQRANPITYATRDAPPFLILHGQQDLLVPYHQSELLYQALSAAGANVTLVTLPHGEHGQWHAFLSDSTVTMGAVVRTSQYGQSNQAQPVQMNWDTIFDFLEIHLRNPNA